MAIKNSFFFESTIPHPFSSPGKEVLIIPPARSAISFFLNLNKSCFSHLHSEASVRSDDLSLSHHPSPFLLLLLTFFLYFCSAAGFWNFPTSSRHMCFEF